MDINSENNCFVTLKDHKENFQNHPTTRLINPAKNELGRISKVILEDINKRIRTSLGINQWKNTASVIEWFKNIHEKHKHKFMVFDVKDFYPSISEKLLNDSLKFAESFAPISKKDKDIISHARKSLLFNEGETWMKRDGKLFDVTMGAYDGDEVCELVGCFILSEITKKYNKNDIGLYRDDGLAVLKNVSGPQSEKIKKEFQKHFKNHNLEIVIQCNMKVVNYLDVTLDLNSGTFQPYHKPDSEINYVHKQSNHPPSIVKQIPLSIQTRLSNLSSNEEIFRTATPFYEEALKRSGYDHKFEFTPTPQQPRPASQQRKRKIIWFNPPFNSNLSTNIGRFFLNLIKKHFPKEHRYHKIFNKNTVKISYSCMPNVTATINMHNKKVLSKQQTPPNQKTCNCINKEECPLNQRCLDSELVYEATLTSDADNKEMKYIGLCETTFKRRYSNHKQSFSTEKYKNSTTLSTEYWRLKETNANPLVKWRILKKAHSYKPESRTCTLCMTEKYEIANYPNKNLLNKRTEIIAKCRHKRKYQLEHYSGD